MVDWDVTTDVLVVGSGGAGLCAALVAMERGLDVLMIEKSEYVGGATGMSGGLVWVPDNPLMREDGIRDSAQDVLTYLDSVVGDIGPASSTERRRAFVTEGPHMVEFLRRSKVPLRRVDGYPDYLSDVPGGHVRGRNIEALLFDTNLLGPWAKRIHAGMFAGIGLVGYGTELTEMLYFNRSVHGLLTAARVQIRSTVARWRHKNLVANGGALVGWMLLRALENGIEIWTESPVGELIVEDGEVLGAVVRKEGSDLRVRARCGVLLAAGGFSRNDDMRAQFGGDKATSAAWSLAAPGDTGEVLQMAMAVGAATDLLDEAIWVPIMRFPDGRASTYPPREAGAFGRSRWRAGSIIVDASGQRYANESLPYRDLGQVMFERNRQVPAIPSWLVVDDDFRRRCIFGSRPGRMPEQWITDGYVQRANSLGELAAVCGIDAAGLERTVDTFNDYARTGVDADFHRGETAYDRYMGDPRHRPNNCLAPIARPPFYAVAIYPGDVGTFGGVLTDERARVLDASGSPINGLYAAGNITAALSGRGYFAAGGSLGPSFTFGFIAGNDLAERAAVGQR